ncbi:hypothetical protein C7T35_33505 [Variovorax sp. WS11]|uniref:DarT ssDNA thymidine ADP-ribosyltransferase family protein n=1 Tax=Variovorax sp. WS11 TaxID=1105204 RepID=UPI000D0D533F|nr:DarT ssDNA thymidine ADP-ribosyltransferase family protein [Variovorax sp. WS11]NDZ17775.1 DUF4433 domain-containing protein [Variovorax sp. WS11]PSL80185.1 hypothetical protein C7T35_33505 [Variovorax sp. WS11]
MPRDLNATPIYHITNITNLPAIIAEGRLVSDAMLAARKGGPAVVIGHNHMKRRRLQETRVPQAGNRFVGEFVPFYFCPRSPMLYSVNLGNTGLPPGSQGEILHLVSSVALGVGLGRQWAISDANAGAAYPDFYTDVVALDSALDWNAINAKYWSQCASQSPRRDQDDRRNVQIARGKLASPQTAQTEEVAKPKGKTTGSGFAIAATRSHICSCRPGMQEDRSGGSWLGPCKSVGCKERFGFDRSGCNHGTHGNLEPDAFAAGDAVTVVGFPLRGLLAAGPQVTAGNATALAGLANNTAIVQISAPVQPGNSGGPVLDSSGNVVGVVTSKLNVLKTAALTGDIAQNVNFAVSPSTLRGFLDANDVKYSAAPSTKILGTADVADIGKRFTVLLECTPE